MEPAWDLPRPNVTKPDRSKVKFSKLSRMLGTTPLEGNNIIWGSLWVFGGSQGGLKGSFWAFSDILKKFILAIFFLSTYAHLDAVLLAHGCQYILVLRI